MKRFQQRPVQLVVLLAFALVAAPTAFGIGGPDMGEGQLANVLDNGHEVIWELEVPHAAVWLTVSTPCGVFHRKYDKGETPKFSLEELGPDNPDGSYTWQIRIEPIVDKGVAEALKEARQSGDTELPKQLWRDGKLPKGPFIQTGEWGVDRGEIVPPETEKGGQLRVKTGESAVAGTELGGNGLDRVTAETVISGDLTVYNSLCVGFDCLANESYGADTIRLKENNLRIHVDDTSTAGSFPNQDWRLEFNSNLNGGAEYFRVIDATAGRNIFTIEANAPSNSLVVDSGGRVGVGTANPVLELHVANGDTPALRLEQTTASGFAAQTWDVAGNETSFFVRDATNGSTLPFRIRPGAASNSLVIDTDDDVGIGILSPTSALHVRRTNGSAKVNVEEASGTEAERSLLLLQNNGVAKFDVQDTSGDGSTWTFETEGPSFRINKNGSGGEEIIVRDRFDGTGNATLVVNGSVEATNVAFPSSRETKTEFVDVDTVSVLERLVALPMTEWQFKQDPHSRRHIGPIAEDFHAAFGLNQDPKHISVVDANGVAMAAIQGLNQLVEQLNERIARLEAELEAKD
ncbi:MAG TPA: tail fiber domain-containing protein [Thermoanaerobaculia bacterium]|nr:tail fiber domain-containing protein [Thermoanaerobaculia bacterium]